MAFRSLSRPSSPPRAKASTVCPCLLSARRTIKCGLIYLKLALLVFSRLSTLDVQHVKDLFSVVPGRVELPTSTLSVWRSNQLSYRTVNIIPQAYKTVPSLLPRSTRRNPRSRKEVFQPHLPVRLPCYDLAPVTSFTLGRSFRLRTSGTPGSHGLTGGVYKARERIHRAMADARLLANPASWGRVADPSPNYDAFY